MSRPGAPRRLSDARANRQGWRDDDEGQVMLLAIGYAVLALLLVTAVVSATSIHLERKRLLTLADLGALQAADAIDADAYFSRDPGGDLVHLDDVTVEAEVADYLASAADAARLHDLALVAASTDGRTVTVTLHAVARPALVSWITAPWSDGIALVVTASARTESALPP